MGEIGVVTVWERPTRVAVTAMFLLAGGLFPAYAVEAATAAAAAWVGLGVVGFTRSSSSSAASSASGFLTRKDHGLRHGLLGVSCP